MLICLSGRYIEQELALHYGRLPPAFLPIGSERLYALQARRFGLGERSILTVPADFDIPTAEAREIEHAGFEIFRSKPGRHLNEAILDVLELADGSENIRILFGDTVVQLDDLIENSSDFVTVKPSRIDYPWTFAEIQSGRPHFYAGDRQSAQEMQVVCGYFSFSDLRALKEAFAQRSLPDALNHYAARRSLSLRYAAAWYDFGHLALFYQSKRDLLVARAFNSLDTDGYSITKTSEQTAKMQAEASWFEDLPLEVVLHTPRYLGRKNQAYRAGYQLEYLHLPTLSDMAVFGRVPPSTLGMILKRCVHLLGEFRKIRPDHNAPEASGDYAARFYDEILYQKTWTRLGTFCNSYGCDLETEFVLNGQRLPPLGKLVEAVLADIPATRPEDVCFWHGDFFFGNLFFDFNTLRVIMVDPRGMLFDNVATTFGDYRYDIGKLAHSVFGGYDHIIANQARLTMPSPFEIEFELPRYGAAQCQTASDQLCQLIEMEYGLERRTIYALAALMFFSMLPLHEENRTRQLALLASGLSLAMKRRDMR